MGETVAKHADLCVVTSDNPRFENPDKIIEDIIVESGKGKGQLYCNYGQKRSHKICFIKC